MSENQDFDNLKLITEGDPALELDLLETFLMTTRSYLDRLCSAHKANDRESWKHELHGMKGGCLNLGVYKLGEMCQAAQQYPPETEAGRSQALQSIQNEFARMEQIVLVMIQERKDVILS